MRTRIATATAALALLAAAPALAQAQQQQPGQQQQAQQAQQAQQQAGPALVVTSDTILQVQRALQRMGHDPGPIDGIWGPRTREAVTSFQEEQGMESTGSLNIATLEAMGFERVQTARAMPEGQQLAAIPRPSAQQGVRPEELGPAATQLIQRRINRRDMDIATDGRWGEETETALRLLQMSRDLPVTGQLDAATLEVLGLDRQELAEAETFPGIEAARTPQQQGQ